MTPLATVDFAAGFDGAFENDFDMIFAIDFRVHFPSNRPTPEHAFYLYYTRFRSKTLIVELLSAPTYCPLQTVRALAIYTTAILVAPKSAFALLISLCYDRSRSTKPRLTKRLPNGCPAPSEAQISRIML